MPLTASLTWSGKTDANRHMPPITLRPVTSIKTTVARLVDSFGSLDFSSFALLQISE